MVVWSRCAWKPKENLQNTPPSLAFNSKNLHFHTLYPRLMPRGREQPSVWGQEPHYRWMIKVCTLNYLARWWRLIFGLTMCSRWESDWGNTEGILPLLADNSLVNAFTVLTVLLLNVPSQIWAAAAAGGEQSWSPLNPSVLSQSRGNCITEVFPQFLFWRTLKCLLVILIGRYTYSWEQNSFFSVVIYFLQQGAANSSIFLLIVQH